MFSELWNSIAYWRILAIGSFLYICLSPLKAFLN